MTEKDKKDSVLKPLTSMRTNTTILCIDYYYGYKLTKETDYMKDGVFKKIDNQISGYGLVNLLNLCQI